MRETEKNNLYNEFKDREGKIFNGYINQVLNNNVILEIGKVEAIMPIFEQIKGENYVQGMVLKVYILKVEDGTKNIKVLLSRRNPYFLRKLLESEFTEIYDGIIEIKGIVRDPGNRAKVAVFSKNLKIDIIGSIVGMKGMRIKNIVDELSGEKIDLIIYNQDVKKFIENAIKPAKVENIYLDEDNKIAEIIVSYDQLSLAIGKGGLNVILAAELTRWHLDIKTLNQKEKGKQEKLDIVVEDF